MLILFKRTFLFYLQCPKCPIKLDKYGRPIKKTTTPKPPTNGAPNLAALAALRAQAQSSGATPNLAALAALRNKVQSPGAAPNLAALAALQNQAQSPSATGNPSSTTCDKSNVDINALLLDPKIRGQIISRLMELKAQFAQFQPALTTNLPPSTTKAATPSQPPSPPEGPQARPPLLQLPAGLPPNLLENPQVQEFIKNNPEIVKKFATEGLPSPDKVCAASKSFHT